jgi:hypothetical protein
MDKNSWYTRQQIYTFQRQLSDPIERKKNGFVDGGMCVCPVGLTDKKEVASCEIQITRFQADKDVFPTDEILERNFGTEKDKIISSVLDEALQQM